MAKGQKGQVVTKKHLARQQREQLQNRYILLISIGVIVIVVGLIAYGVIQQYVIQPQQPVAQVGNTTVSAKDFQTFVRYERLQYIQQYQQYQQFAQLFGSDQTSQSYIQQYLSQIEYQMQPTNLGQNALDYLVANRIIEQEASKRGITVSDAEVNTQLESYFGYYPNGTPTSAPTTVPIPTSTLNPTQLFLVPPTATPTAIPTQTATPTAALTTAQVTTTPTLAATPTTIAPTGTPLPTNTPFTTQAYAKQLSTYMADYHTFASLTEDDFRWIFHMQLLRQKVLEAVTSGTSHTQDQVWARQIVSGTQEQAQSVYARLQNGGDFMTIATEIMSGTQNTIDLGWFGSTTIDANAEKVVWNLKIGQYSEPLQTANGWTIYEVLGHEVRQLSDSQYQTLQQTDFNDWITQQKTALNVQTFDRWKSIIPTSPTIPPTQSGQAP